MPAHTEDKIDRLTIRDRPDGYSIMKQKWGKLLFIHWPIPVEVLRPLIPAALEIDTFDGMAWIAVVPFTMWGIRPTFTLPLPGLNAFHELNVRTYVHYKGVPGVWFFSLDANSQLAVWGARKFFYLPYRNARMQISQDEDRIDYFSERVEKKYPPAVLKTSWQIGDALEASLPGSIEFFLTERYCLYTVAADDVFRCRIFHPSWPLRTARLLSFRSTMLEAAGIQTPTSKPILHYAEEVSVNIWPLLRVN